MSKFIRRVQYFFRQRRIDAELAEELEFHRAERQARLEQSGLSADEAAYASRRQIGNVTLAREDARGVWIAPWLEGLWQDVRYACRGLRRSPAYAAAAALTLALGIGANTAIFSVIEAVLLRPLAYADADRLVRIGQSWNGVDPGAMSPPNFLDLRAASQVFDSMSPVVWFTGTLTGAGRPESVNGQQVSSAFFPMLGAQPLVGRTFMPADDEPGRERVVVLSHELWQRRFASDRRVLGSGVTLDGAPCTIVGVMPPGFGFGAERTDVWKPGAPGPEMLRPNHRIWEALYVVARLRPGVPPDAVRTDLATNADRIRAANPRWFTPDDRWTFVAQPLQTDWYGSLRAPLLLLWSAVTLVLLIACANAASLSLARASSRDREFAIRIAIGAGRRRLMRLLLLESMLVAALGATVGVLLAMWGIPLVVLLQPSSAFGGLDVGIDRGVLVFAVLTTVATGLAAGLLPALQATKPGLAGMTRQASEARAAFTLRSPRGALVVGEVALALVLLAAAGLVVKSFGRLVGVHPGFDASGLMLAGVTLPEGRYGSDAARSAFYRAAIASLDELGAVQGAALTTNPPLTGSVARTRISISGSAPDGEPVSGTVAAVTPGYFRTMRIPIVAGRGFTDADTAEAARVIVIDEALGRRFFGGANPIGRHVTFGTSAMRPRPWEIVGVAGHVKHGALDEGAGDLEFYYPLYQGASESSAALVVRTTADPTTLVRPVEDAIQRVDRDQPIAGAMTMTRALSAGQARSRFLAVLVGAFAVMAMLLSALGLFSLMAYAVSRRTPEVGVRMALGARPWDILALVVRQGLTLVGVGIAAGFASAATLAHTLSPFLFEVSAADPAVFAGVTCLLSLIALLACVVPARRAARVDPVVALRME